MKRIASALLLVVMLSGCAQSIPPPAPAAQSGYGSPKPPSASSASSGSEAVTGSGIQAGTNAPDFVLSQSVPSGTSFGAAVAYEEPAVKIDPAIAKDFSLDEVKNLDVLAKTFGITLSANDRKLLEERKFLLKRLPETSITPGSGSPGSGEHEHEFHGLYWAIRGGDAKSRTQANAVFYSADIFFHSYTLLETELLKEMEITTFAPAMRTLSKKFYLASVAKLAAATTDADRTTWRKVRNYFAIPYALFATAVEPPSFSYDDGQDPEKLRTAFLAQDPNADSEANVVAFIRNLGLDTPSRDDILADIHSIMDPQQPGVPAVFRPEFDDYAQKTHVSFKVDFTQFTPRSHYTGTSLRRQYFRAMNWYIQIPFFVESDALTTYAFAVSSLMAEQPDQLKSYSLLESTINFLVGTSDDLMPADYLAALESAKKAPDREGAIRAYLLAAKKPKIKSLAATYDSVGTEDSDAVRAKTAGMRFFSGKFIMDSAWTGYLTQGDEKPRPGYPGKLPPLASSLEVMALLGSDYARANIPMLDFYKTHGKAVDKGIADLTRDVQAMTEADWRQNAYTSALWADRGLFAFEQPQRAKLPAFMRSVAWPAKTLQTAAGFWTELRHTVLLYAKQSFAELGGGGSCDTRKVPEPPKAYVEPQPIAFRRMRYLAQRTLQGLKDLGFTLQNFSPMESYIDALDTAITYTDKELANTALTESVKEHRDPDSDQPSGTCVWYEITQSDWETLRVKLMQQLENAQPTPVEGPVLTAKDKRAAILADVHTGGDSQTPTQIVYEGTGVPAVIIAAVKDANGPRATIGFTYTQYEFRTPLDGKRKTDEQWQETFYKGKDDDQPYDYTSPATWPVPNPWYAPLFGK